jgi:hypothetical protein
MLRHPSRTRGPFDNASPTIAPPPSGDEQSGGLFWSSGFTPSMSGGSRFTSDAISRVTDVPILSNKIEEKKSKTSGR